MKTSLSFIELQKKLIYIFFISQFFFLLSFGNIGTLPLTVPFIVGVIYLVISFLGVVCGQIKIGFYEFCYFFIVFATILVSSLVSKYGFNFSSFMLYVFYFSMFLLLDKRIRGDGLDRILDVFIKLSTILSIYGIYQFIAYNFITELPLKELIPESMWTIGYNTIQSTRVELFERNIIKAHSIYAEASGFSRFSALAIIFLFLKYKNYKMKKVILGVIINGMGMAFSLSGSGVILLIAALIYSFFVVKTKKRFLLILFLVVLLFFYFAFEHSELLLYYVNRINEFKVENSSAYYRFILPFKIGFNNIQSHFFGFGAGNDEYALEMYHATEVGVANGFGKVFVELGLIGLIEVFYLFFMLRQGKKDRDIKHSFLVLIAIIINIVSTFLNPTLWSFILLLAIDRKKVKSRNIV